ncbi:MAG: DNA primase, partial [Verrucomicrobiota bacterium]|nr:DNA primase [Verrucomicrobiota bacterium]
HRLTVAVDAVRTEFTKRKRTFQRVELELAEEEIPIPEDELPLPKPSPVEFWLLKLALFGETPVEWLESHLDLQWVGHHGVREILQQHFALIAENPDAGPPELLAVLPSEPFRKLATEAVVDGRNIPNPDRQLKDIVLRLRNQFIEARLAEIQRDLSPGSTDEERWPELISERNALKDLITHPLEPLAGS